LFGPTAIKITGKSGISQARTRVSWEPLKRLFETVAIPLAKPGDKGAFFHGHRVVAIDGTLFDVADTPENDKAFGRPNGIWVGSYPQARLVGLVECGTHAFFRAEIVGYRDSEQAVAPKLLPHLRPNMVCLADRNFMSFDLFKLADQTKAKLVWRVRKDVKLPVEERLKDGSYLSTIYSYHDRKRSHGMKVRVIEYRIESGNEPIRLLTNWYDYKEAPVQELAELYHERWEYESTLDEVKTHLGANAMTLRSRTPDLVKQELLGLLMGHYAIRAVMHEAAQSAKIDDDELSFTHSVQVIRRRLPMFGNFPPEENSQSNHCRDLATTSVV
jgi:Transposase DDE domain